MVVKMSQWHVSNPLDQQTLRQKQESVQTHGGCIHVVQDISLAHTLRRERVSSGSILSQVCCKQCSQEPFIVLT